MTRRRETTMESVALEQVEYQEQTKTSWRTKVAMGAGALMLAGSSVLGGAAHEGNIPTANADEQVFVGGNCNPNGDFVRQKAIEQGTFNPHARHPEIVYPASIAPICGDVRMKDSVNIGADRLMDEYLNNAPGEHYYVESFSLGGAVANEFGNRITDRGRHPLPHNVHIINHGDAYGAPGILNHPIAPLARIVTDPMGIPPGSKLKPAPGTLIRLDINDFYANGGNQGLDLGAVISMAARIPQDHRIPNPAEPHESFVYEGVTYEVYGLHNRDGISRAIAEAGGDPTDIGRWFFGILAGPQNPADSWRFNPPTWPRPSARAKLASAAIPAPPPPPPPIAESAMSLVPPAPVQHSRSAVSTPPPAPRIVDTLPLAISPGKDVGDFMTQFIP